MNRQYMLGALVVVVIAGGVFWYSTRTAVAPGPSAQMDEAQSTTTPNAATSLVGQASPPSPTAPKSSSPFKLSLVKGDAVASWSFQGAYSGNAELTQKAQVEIARLSSLLGSGKFTDYDLYVSIANQYDLLGDGAKELTYLEKALTIDSTHTGLAWENTGNLMSRLGAYLTARVAFENAVTAQPDRQYVQTLIDFLKEHFPQDSDAIQKAQKLLQ